MVEGMDINGNMMFATEVIIVNVSISGMSIRADRRLDMGSEYTIRLRDDRNEMAVKGRIVWSSLIGTSRGRGGEAVPVYSAGMKFSDVMNPRLAEMIGYMEKHICGDEHRLSGLRFTISRPGSAVLQYPSKYLVRKISAGGMLIESGESISVEERYTMELSFPEEEPIRFVGRVASCLASHRGGKDRFDVGIEFVEMDEAARNKVHEFIFMLKEMGEGL